MRCLLAALAISSLGLSACKAPIPGRSAEEQAAKWSSGEWRDDIGNIWQATVEGGKVTAKGVAGASQGLTLSGAFTAEGLPYTIALPDGSVIAEGEARLIDDAHASFATRLIDGQTNAHGLLHFDHPPTIATMLESGGAQLPQVSDLSGAWMDDGGNIWAVSVDREGRLTGVGASGAVIGGRFEGSLAGGVLQYVATAPDGSSTAGSGQWDGGCHVSWQTLAATPLLENGGQLHVNHAPGQACDGSWPAPAETPLDGAVDADLSAPADPVSGETTPVPDERGPVDLTPK